MNQNLKFLLLLPAVVLLAGCGKPRLKTEDQKISYGWGVEFGNEMLRQRTAVLDRGAVLAGVRDALDQAPVQLTEDDLHNLLEAKRRAIADRHDAELQAAASKNVVTSGAFLAENKTKPGVRTTASGLQYRVVKEGTGKRPTDASRVAVLYTGTVANGPVFADKSKEKVPPVVPVAGPVAGWTEGLKLMREGAIYEFYFPPALGFGDKGNGRAIPGNAVVIFRVELVKVQ